MAKETVNHPGHYNTGSIECIDIIRNMGFNLGSVVKYLWRFEHKNKAEDLQKALWYLEDIKSHTYLVAMFHYVPLDTAIVSEIVKDIDNIHIKSALSAILYSLHYLTPTIIDSIIENIEKGIILENEREA